MTRLLKLISIATEALSPLPPAQSELVEMPLDLITLLNSRNGFSAFESALVVFPSVEKLGVPGVREWNDLTNWRHRYRGVLADEYICFAQDLFGGQFAVSTPGIVRLNPENGSVTSYAHTIEEWAKRLLENYEEDTAWPLAHEWQVSNGILPPNMRLLPKIPFVLGG